MDRILRDDRFHRFSAYNPTVGTGIVMGIVSAFSATKALFTMVNPADSQFNLVPEWLALRCSAQDTNSTNLAVAIVQDPTDRTGGTPGGTALTPADHKVSDPRTPDTLVRFGAVTPAAASGNEARLFGEILKDSQVAVGDEFRLDFDDVRPGGIAAGPMVLRPGDSLLVHAWGANMATDAPSFEVHAAWREVQDRGL